MATSRTLPSNYKYLIVNESQYATILRIKEVCDELSVWQWIKQYSALSKTTWRTSATFPNCGRLNRYRVNLRCVHLTDKRAEGVRSSKNTGCPAKLEIIIRRFYKNSKSRCKDHLLPDWPCVVTFKRKHNHAIGSADILKYRDMSDETRSQLSYLFWQGYKAFSALLYLKMHYLLQYGERFDEIAIDSYYLPTYSVVHKMFRKQYSNFAVNDDEDDDVNMYVQLKDKLARYNEREHGRVEIFNMGEHRFVVICTPIMVRAHTRLKSAKRAISIDLIGRNDKRRSHRVCFLVTPTDAGDVPLGMFISDTDKSDVLRRALEELLNILPASFCEQRAPETILTDNDWKANELSVDAVFPNSRLLWCRIRLLKAVWKWLHNSANNVNDLDRRELYRLVRNVVCSATEEDRLKSHRVLLRTLTASKYLNFINHYGELWSSKDRWQLDAFRNCISYARKPGGGGNDYYLDVIFRIVRHTILDRLVAKHNVYQIADFVVTILEKYVAKHLIDFSKGRYLHSKVMLKNIVNNEQDEQRALNVLVDHQTDDLFIVTTGKSCDDPYFVDVLAGVCSCMKGRIGKLCSHISIVLLSLDDAIKNVLNRTSSETRQTMFYVATGKEPGDDNSYESEDNCNDQAAASMMEIVEVEQSSDYRYDEDGNDNDDNSNGGNDNDGTNNDDNDEDFTTASSMMEEIEMTTSGSTDDDDETEIETITSAVLLPRTDGDQFLEDECNIFCLSDNDDVRSTIILENDVNLSRDITDARSSDCSTVADAAALLQSDTSSDVVVLMPSSTHPSSAKAAVLEKLSNLICRVRYGVESQPSLYSPALANMLSNEKQYASTESHFLHALRTFGTYTNTVTRYRNILPKPVG